MPARAQLRELCFDGFAVLHSGATRTPIYAAQRLNKQALGGIKRQRSDRFFADGRLPRSEREELDDYKRSGYSRGHMAASGDMATEDAMAQSFSLANMVPQSIRHNSGAWSKIEQDTRKYVQRAKGDVYVVTGAVFGGAAERVGPNGVGVPSHLFKLVHDARTGQTWVHWQANRDDERPSRPITYEELVRRTSVEWLPMRNRVARPSLRTAAFTASCPCKGEPRTGLVAGESSEAIDLAGLGEAQTSRSGPPQVLTFY